MGWREERAHRRHAREMERARRELADLDQRLWQESQDPIWPALPEPSEPPRRPRRRGPLVPLLVTILVTVAAARLVGAGPSNDGSASLVDRLAAVAGSLSGGFESGLVYADGVEGEAGSGGPGYSFARLQPDRVTPATWPCGGTIPIEVNPSGAPPDYETLVAAAVARVNAASGFGFEVVGETTDRDFLDRGRGPVLLGFADEAEIELLAEDAAGLGGSTYAVEAAGGQLTAVGGLVALDSDVYTEDLPREYGEAILMHELAHVLGLGHTDRLGELMGSVGSGQTDFGAGDLAGLAHLRQAACS